MIFLIPAMIILTGACFALINGGTVSITVWCIIIALTLAGIIIA